MKDIVIIANFCRDFSKSDNGRFMYLCKELSKDNKVEIVTSDFGHSTKKHKDPLTIEWPFTITFLHEPGYRKNISIQRFLSHRAWGNEVKRYLAKRKKPDIIYCSVPSLSAPLKASEYCKEHKIKFIIDIQDLWPEAFQMVFNVPVLSRIVFIPFKKIADRIYSCADEICGVSKTYVDRALSVNSKVKSGHVVFLGTSLQTFDENAQRNVIIKENSDDLWIGYCGTLGASYDLTVVFDALCILRHEGIKLPKFIILGDGERRKEFENYAAQLELDCVFTGRLPYDQMCGWLNACDIAVNPIKHRAAQSIINKHGDYASAGLPVLNTQENQEYRDLVRDYDMGFNCSNSDPADLADKLKLLIVNPEFRVKMGENARRCAEERFDRRRTYQELIRTMYEDGK